ncbi:chromate transporter [Acidiphilium sp. AL]|uniref:Chromate transporter n=1 Tax=Acidiphilium iwatense TaxID=768198 RepID=A0ABS9DVW9_9PROT|nr:MULTISPECIES: chromate transporter [Acidiphilium]MCF3946876.1 chromate transporter [Acidiphilium iwatense]MCU4161061.1 chromate transporter [Acidiphilium sp. AL]
MILLALVLLFAEMSLLAIGGVASTLPAMARAVVARHWLTAPQFAALFGVAQSSPGPNMLIATLIGLHVAGISGALAASAAMIAPSSTLTVLVSGLWERFRAAHWRRVVQAAITPITGGLLLAAASFLIRAADHDWRAAAITLVVALFTLKSRVHPLLLLAGGALIGVLGYA